MSTFGPYPAIVADVHDGDTLTLIIDLGFNIAFQSACRCYGINAPELATTEGKAALDYALTLIKPGDKCTVGRFDGAVTLVLHGWDKYGADGRDFGVAMVIAEHAKPYFGIGPKT